MCLPGFQEAVLRGGAFRGTTDFSFPSSVPGRDIWRRHALGYSNPYFRRHPLTLANYSPIRRPLLPRHNPKASFYSIIWLWIFIQLQSRLGIVRWVPSCSLARNAGMARRQWWGRYWQPLPWINEERMFNLSAFLITHCPSGCMSMTERVAICHYLS